MNGKIVWAFVLAATAVLAACDKEKDDPPDATYTVGGAVTGLTSAGLVLSINGTNVAVASGATSFVSSAFPSATAYTVTQGTKPATQTCTVTNGTGTVGSANVTNVVVTCVTDTFSVAATVSGLTGTGLMLQLNGGAGLGFAGNVSQTFANRVNSGTAYAVTVQAQPTTPNQQCTVTNGSGPSISANVTNVTVACVNSTGISGVAAVGSPLAGTVTVKDSSSPAVIRSTPLGSNGSYSVDVSGMTPPFVFRAEGTANGHTYVVHSAAVAADVGGTINITQLTDLVVANIAGQVASAYFDNPNFSLLTPAALNAEIAMLKSRLLPVLTALGVDASIDLLRSRFTPLMDALDDALDVLRVSVDAAINMATISNIVTQQSIQDAINVPAAAESNPPVLDNVNNVANAVTDNDAIKTALTSFAAKFATTLPSVANVQASFTSTFLEDDTDGPSLAAYLASNSGFIGVGFTDVDIKSIDYSNLTQVTALVDFTIRNRNGVEDERVTNWQIRKGTDGIWRLHGNQRVMDVGGHVHLYRNNNGCKLTGLEFSIEDNNSANNGGVINHVSVFGPGLPIGGLRFAPPAVGGGDWQYINVPSQPNSSYYRMANSCVTGAQAVTDAVIGAIPDNATYVFAAYASADDTVRINFPSGAIASGPNAGMYWLNIQKRPLTLAEVLVSTRFPTIAAPSVAAFAAYTSGDLAISASGFVPDTFADIILEQNTASGNFRGVDTQVVASSTGTASTTLALTAPAPGDTITNRSLRVATDDIYRRTFMTGIDTAQTYTVSGTVSGLTGTLGLILYSGITPNSFTVQPGATTFTPPFALANGTTFNVAIATQPAGQTCLVTRSSGTIANSNVSGVAITCVANTTSPLAGTFTGVEPSEGIYIALTLAADGRYVLAMQHPAAVNCRNAAGQTNNNIIEYGVYNYIAATGSFRAVMAAVDPTDDCGFIHAGFPPFSATIIRNGNSLTFNYADDNGNPASFTLTAATNTTGQLLGSYELPNGRVLTLLSDGTYVSTVTQERPAGAAANAFTLGFEHGCYTSTSTAITIDLSSNCQPAGLPAIDTNGSFMLSVNGQARTIPYQIINTPTGDVLSLFNTTSPIYYTRIQSN